MSHFFELPVYKSAVNLLKTLSENTHTVPRWAQITDIDPMKHMCVDLLVFIGKAKHKGEEDMDARKRYLLEAASLLEEFKYRLRALKDVHYLTPEGMGNICKYMEETRRQIVGWGRSCGLQLQDFEKPVIINPKDVVIKRQA